MMGDANLFAQSSLIEMPTHWPGSETRPASPSPSRYVLL